MKDRLTIEDKEFIQNELMKVAATIDDSITNMNSVILELIKKWELTISN